MFGFWQIEQLNITSDISNWHQAVKMNSLFAVLITAALIMVSSIIFSSSIQETFSGSSDAMVFSQGKDLMNRIDTSVISLMLAGNGSMRLIKLPNIRGHLDVSASDDTVNYSFDISSPFIENASTENNIQISQYGNKVALILNYSGKVDIVGDVNESSRLVEIVGEDTLNPVQVRFRSI